MIDIECKIDDFLEEFEKDIKKTIKDNYIEIVEQKIKNKLDKTSLKEEEKETKLKELKEEISNSLQIKESEKIEDFMKRLNREINITIDENTN